MPKELDGFIRKDNVAIEANKGGSEERELLHDLSTPLSTAIFLTDALAALLKDHCSHDAMSHILRISAALDKMKKLIESRREILHSKGPK
jgi:hypothetical protein